ncbi:FtsH protease activity modulator HflK [Marivibrio halodurans]|uniref:Protein HflK n=1 Tax=Marivibrio halodurans TaxID=2039722 RepID=A0A8J7SNA6_9PROT|nr:FtsH protease activity modulator HflK [Marivibrio halodurans]MBP5857898.1 FtsH protease activity modulator HflK [Marivibrio halodurans]
MPWQNNGGGPWGGGGGSNGGGGGGPQSPWGRGSGGGGGRRPQPPDTEEMIRQAQDRLKRMIPGGFGGGKLAGVIAAIVVAVWLATGFYQVNTNEQGVELVFGELWQTTGEGLNYNFPAPIGDVLLPQVTNINQINIGFRDGGRSTARNVAEESLMLTGDENIIDVQFTVFWKIRDAGRYLFNIRNPDDTVKNAAESAMREIIGQTPFEFARTNGRAEVENQAQDLTQQILDSYEAGILVTNIETQSVDPPESVLDAFRDVQAAAADRERSINEATAYLNEITNRAQGQAEQVVRAAEAYKEEQINQAKGETDRFLAILTEYNQAKDVTKRRIYLQTMENIFANMEKVLIENGEGGGSGVLPYLPLDVIDKDRAGRTNPLQQDQDDIDGSSN